MKKYTGIIVIGEISNCQDESSSRSMELPRLTGITESSVRFVHYPDSQQLLIWLTHPGREYGNLRLRDRNTKKIIEEWPVADKLNGSIQLCWDSLSIAPGNYTIEIDWSNGWQHHIEIQKFKTGITPKKKVSSEGEKLKKISEEKNEPVQYRDGFGKIIENEDMVLRDKLKKDIARKFSRRISYEGNVRAGTIIYMDNDIRIEFPHEMGGGNCMFYIDIPTEKLWEAGTKTPLSARKEILQFVAETVRAEQASGCNFEIKDDTIGFYYK